MMYELYNNTLCVRSNFLIDNQILKLSHYTQLIRRGYLNLVRRGGNGRYALIEFATMRDDIKRKVIQLAGDPKETANKSIFENYIERDATAAHFFKSERTPKGKPFTPTKQIEYYTNAIILNAVGTVVQNKATTTKKITGNKTRLWENLSNAINALPSSEYPHSLPGNYRSLQRLYTKYHTEGYAVLVHGGTGNVNRLKITQEISDWLLAQYCLPNKPYISMIHAKYEVYRIEKGWPTLTAQAIELHLEKPELKRIWTLARNGKDDFSNKFGHKLSRNREDWFPNCYWAIDGTKLDWVHYFDNKLGMAAKLKINPVFDIYSEMIIGYSISETENHTDHFTALKSAVNFSGARPYKLTYDNQSGHKSQRMQDLYDNVIAKDGGVHNPTRPREKSNPAEQIFNRLQQQVISTFWFSDKQSVKARNIDNVPNIDFLLTHKEYLLDREQLVKAWDLAVRMWNEAPHPHFDGLSRIEVYRLPTPMNESFDTLDMIDTFWVNETKEITYKSDGLILRIAGQKYFYEVYDQNNKIDLNFRKYNIGKKFIVRYDPEALDGYIQLLELDSNGEKTLINHALPKRKHQEIPVLMKEGDKALWAEDMKVRDIELEETIAELEALRRRTGITPERMIEEQELMIKMGGDLPKDDRSDTEANSIYSYL